MNRDEASNRTTSRPLSERELRFQAVLVAYLEGVETGAAPDRAALLAQHAEFAEELRGFFADRDHLDLLAQPLRQVAEREAVLAATVGAETDPSPNFLVRYVGDYELIDEIARGGMGVVFKARQISLNRLVAVKMILAGQLASPEVVQRFRAEAEAVANLDHPGIVPIYEVGEFQGHHYFSMKLLEGGSLARLEFAGATRKSQRHAAELVAKAARAVHHAHQRGILHRDLKPANILLDLRHQPHVTDFGLAKLVEADSALTRTGAILGTPNYMAPEQSWGDPQRLTTAADVYGLGAILYDLMTGQPPFRGRTALETILKLREQEPPRPSVLQPRTDRELETIALKCLEKEPARRYGSALALAEDLERWVAGEPILARRTPAWQRVWKWARRRPAIAGLLGAVALVALLGFFGILYQWNQAVQARDQEQFAHRAAVAARDQEKRARQEEAQAKVRAEEARRQEAEARQMADKLRKVAETDRDEKTRALHRAEGLRISAEAAAARQHDQGLALMLAHHAVQQVPCRLTFQVLHDALDDCREIRAFVGHQANTRQAFFALRGNAVVSVAEKHAAQVWDTLTGKHRHELVAIPLPVGALAMSPDGSLAALAYEGWTALPHADGVKRLYTDRVVSICDVATGKERLRLRGHESRVVALAFHPRGHQLLTGALDGSARLWQLSDGATVAVYRESQCAVLSVAFTPEGSQVVVVTSNALKGSSWPRDPQFKEPGRTDPDLTIPLPVSVQSNNQENIHLQASGIANAVVATLWDTNTHQKLRDFRKAAPDPWKFGHQWLPNAANLSPNGQFLAMAFKDYTALWSLADGKRETWALKDHGGEVLHVEFSPDSRRLATAGEDGAIHLYDTTTGKNLATFKGHRPNTMARGVAWHPQGKLLLSYGDDRTARLWDTTTGDERAVLRGHHAPVTQARFSQSGDQILTVGDQTARLWRAAPPPPLEIILAGHDKPINSLQYSPNGQLLVTASEDGTCRLWQTSTGALVHVLGKNWHLGPVRDARFNHDGSLVVTSSANCSVNENGKLVNSSAVHVWETASGTHRAALKDHRTGARGAWFGSDATTMLTMDDGYQRDQVKGWLSRSVERGNSSLSGRFRCWNTNNGKTLWEAPKLLHDRIFPCFGNDGKQVLLAYQNDTSACLLATGTGQVSRTLGNHQWHLTAAAMNPQATRVVTCGSDGAQLWNARDGRLLGSFFDNNLPEVDHVRFSPNGRLFATLQAGIATIRDANTAQRRGAAKDHEQVTAVSFSRDGHHWITGATDGTLCVWETATNVLQAFYRGPQSAVRLVEFHPNGRQIASTAADGTARFWPLDWNSTVTRRFPRELTPAERTRYELPKNNSSPQKTKATL